MIFTDKDTAEAFRQRAETALKDWALAIFEDGQKYTEASKESAHNYIETQAMTLPPEVAILLYRSGIIGPEDNEGVAPIVTYYDEDKDNKVMETLINNPDRLIGGIVDSKIHT